LENLLILRLGNYDNSLDHVESGAGGYITLRLCNYDNSLDHVESGGYITLRTLAQVINSLDKTSEASGAGFADQIATADHQNVIII
jgi:hypothetical protein